MKVLSAVAWPYANGPRHLGHVAGFAVPSDVFSRYMRMAGHDVLMVSGTDEHGTPILVQADKEGTTARELADTNNRIIAQELADLGCSYDLFTRTTTANHYAVAQELFTQVWKNGYMIERTTQGAISPSTGRTLPDRYIEGTCPICGYGEARGDQCDNCGNQLDPTELIDPRSKINGEVPEFIETQHFFLDLPALADALREWLEEREASGTWRPNVIKFSLNILDDIKPRAMTRDIDWGIPVPLDGWREQPTKRLYVWFDAVIGYLSASVEWARRLGEPERWREWWNDPEALTYYFMGKDNITFHSQIWPAELLALCRQGRRGGEPGELRRAEPAHRGGLERVPHDGGPASSPPRAAHVIYVRDVLSRYQPDALRYFICAAGTGEPGQRLHLARVRQPHQRRARRRLGQPRQPHGVDGRQELRRDPGRRRADRGRRGAARQGARRVRHRRRPHRAAPAATGRSPRRCASSARSTSTSRDQAPFKLKGEDERERLGTILHVTAQAVVDLNTILSPFLPHSANAVHATFGGDGEFMPMPRLDEVADLDDGRRLPGDHRRVLRDPVVGVAPGPCRGAL